MERFITYISNSVVDDKLFKITFSKPRTKHDELRNVYLRPVQIGDQLVYQSLLRSKTNDQTKNYNTSQVVDLAKELLSNRFFNADLHLENQKITILQSKKGKVTILTKSEKTDIAVGNNDHQKTRLISESRPYLQDLGLASSNGKIYAHSQDKYKQINKYVELISGLIKKEAPSSIVDMGSGKGYLTFALYDYLQQLGDPDLSVTGVEIRPDLIQKCNLISDKHALNGLGFDLGSIDDYQIGDRDMVIALHACDIATDMAIAKGLEAKAQYIVVAPCCHKQIRKAMRPTSSHLTPLLQHGILKERQAEMVTDTIRALILQSKGYDVKVFEFISSEHTGKNVMITAVNNGKSNPDAMKQVIALKTEFGIEEHYLEKLV